MATGSVLVRAAMFESLGDVVSSAIMSITQSKVSDTRDMHQYPAGKQRLVPLGVLFFCAFMCSAMSSMAIDALSALASNDGASEDSEGGAALRRLFEEKPEFQKVVGDKADQIIAEYGGGDGSSFVDSTSVCLLMACVAVKISLFLFCKYVMSVKKSEIVNALATDHFNDTLSNSLVIGVMIFLAHADKTGNKSPWLLKVDPGCSLLLSLWILYGWIDNSLAQLKALSDRRAEDANVKTIAEAVVKVLKGSHLELKGADVHYAGEGLRVRLDLRPFGGSKASKEIAELLQAVDAAVRESHEDIVEVDHQIRVESAPAASPDSFAWVSEYSSKV
eukprot:CAMPEP_0170616754 /NCGR_PEP_ID=MMETSP0224-20130122/26036_1 /TAXON_ID=285029 /ORGANISM="Togula jolla, Strain CCCM 725" /LENGTH=332 /DNA_ID=CAMNT_0010942567 /DNA_START=165 /DNA_END=1163 /DNA_ORIENTATION=+